MQHRLLSHNHRARTALLGFVLAPAVALIAGCSAHGDSNAGDPGSSPQQELIGGEPAGGTYFRSTVGINDVCTAAKVGPRHFLTAAHCVAVPRPGRRPVDEGFPPNGGVQEPYLSGKPLLIQWGLNARDENDEARGTFTIVETSIHGSWWACPVCEEPNGTGEGAADIAVIEIAEATPDIPEARVELSTIGLGTHVIKVGYGCEDRENVPSRPQKIGRYKAEDAWTVAASQIRQYDERVTDEDVAMVGASYLITAGRAQDPNYASLCPGDSGGPLYLPDTSDPRIVGINSDYTFPPVKEPDLGGVSWTDWHTRTSLESLHGVGEWLIERKVNTVNGASPER